MIWDLVLAYFGITFAVAGWNVGLRNSWPAPFAMVFATVATQFCYGQFSALLIESTAIPVALAVFVSYAFLWLVLEFIGEAALALALPIAKQYSLGKWQKAGGACLGFVKGCVVMLFATLASYYALDVGGFTNYPLVTLWLMESSHESHVLAACQDVATKLPDKVTHTVLAKAPSYEPNVSGHEQHHAQFDETAHKVRVLMQAIKQLEEETEQF